MVLLEILKYTLPSVVVFFTAYFILKQRQKIALFKNIGTTTQAKFQLITRDFANVSALNISHVRPTFGDVDGDNDADMFIGDYEGTIHYFEKYSIYTKRLAQDGELSHMIKTKQCLLF